MNLFHAINIYQLLCCITLRKKNYENEKAILMIPDYMANKINNKQQLKMFFDNVIIFNDIKALPKNKSFKDGTNLIFSQIFKENNYTINEFENIVVGGAHYFFGIYLCEFSIPFIFLEDASGMLTRSDLLEKINSNAPMRNRKCIEHGLYNGFAKNITKIYCNTNAQQKDIISDKIEHLNPVEDLRIWSNSDIINLLDVFGLETYLNKDISYALLLTQHFYGLNLLSYEDNILIYRFLIDFFLEDYNLLIKPHPSDLIPYGRTIKNVDVVKEKFPSELIPFAFKIKPDVLVSVSSTATFSLRDSFNRVLEFDSSFEKDFKLLIKYYAAFKIIAKLNPCSNIKTIGINNTMACNLINYTNDFSDLKIGEFESTETLKDDEILIVNNLSFEDLDLNAVLKEHLKRNINVIFLNNMILSNFFDFNEMAVFNILPITITKKCNNKDWYNDDVDEIIYFYTQGGSKKKMINEYKFEKELKQLDLTINKDELTEDQIKVKVLEGILNSTEKRLNLSLMYTSKLENEIERLKRGNVI